MEAVLCKVIPYDVRYRDDMIFMVLEAKNALGRVPRLNPDLLDIEGNYLNHGDMFWLALDAGGRVIGCIGYRSIPDSTEARLHRLYIKADLKRRGLGSRLLTTAETYLREHGKTAVLVHLGDSAYFESYHFYPKHGYVFTAQDYVRKEL